jgi:hypothetical protein
MRFAGFLSSLSFASLQFAGVLKMPKRLQIIGELVMGTANPKTPTKVETDGSLKPIFLKLHLGSSSRRYENVAGVKEGGKMQNMN